MSRSAFRARLNGCQLPGTSERTMPPHMPQVLTISAPRWLIVATHGRGDALGAPLHETYRQLFAEQERDHPTSYGQPHLQGFGRHGKLNMRHDSGLHKALGLRKQYKCVAEASIRACLGARAISRSR